jgi:hypothetical protein
VMFLAESPHVGWVEDIGARRQVDDRHDVMHFLAAPAAAGLGAEGVAHQDPRVELFPLPTASALHRHASMMHARTSL